VVAPVGGFRQKGKSRLGDEQGCQECGRLGGHGAVERQSGGHDQARHNDDRVRLAYSLLQPNADGSVDLVRLRIDRGKVTGRDGVTWSRDEFAAKIQYLNALAEELRSLNGELRTFNTIPDLGWMPSGSFEPMYLRPMSAALTVIGSQPVVIVEDTTKK
jgi:hypothetical protein